VKKEKEVLFMKHRV